MLTATVIIPTYNYGQFIVQAIESVLSQQGMMEKPQIIVVDDGSTDDTATRLKDFIEEGLFEYVAIKQGGKALATCLGIKLATGDIIFTLDADDWFLPGKIETTINLFDKYPELTHVASPARIVYTGGSRTDETEVPPSEILGRVLPGRGVMQLFLERKILFGGGSTFACRASVLKKLLFPEGVDMYTDEWLVMNALHAGDTFFVQEPLSVWRVHNRNFSVGGPDKQVWEEKQKRLLLSSGALLLAMKAADLPAEWQKLYTLKHAVRQMVSKEINSSKSIRDRLRFLVQVILSGRYSFKTLFHYHAFNRLLK